MSAGRILVWTVRALLLVLLLFVLIAAGLWWWAGQDGSLEWTLRRVAAGQPLKSEGVHGSLRAGWHIERLTWEGPGLRVEAEDIRLDWEPLAMIVRTLRLDHLSVARARVIDTRPPSPEPFRPPLTVRLPWRVNVDDLVLGEVDYRGATVLQVSRVMGRYAYDGGAHELHVDGLQVAGGSYRGHARLEADAPLKLEAQLAGRVAAPLPGGGKPLALQFRATVQGPLADLRVGAQLQAPGNGASATQLPAATVTARVTPFEAMPVPEAQAVLRAVDLQPLWPGAPHTQLAGRAEVVPTGTERWELKAELRNGVPGPWDQGRLPLESARGEGEWRSGMAVVKSLQAQLAGGTIEGSGAWEGEGWRFSGKVEQVDPNRLHGQLAALPLTGPVKVEGRGDAIDFDVALQAGQPARAWGNELQAAMGALELREAAVKGRYQGSTIALAPLRLRTSDGLLEGELELDWQAWAGRGKLQLRAPGLQAEANGSLAATQGKGTLALSAADFARTQQWLQRWPGMGATLAGLQLRGQGEAKLAWSGGWRDPTVQASVQASRVQWQADAARGADVPLPWQVRSAQLRLEGRLRDAALDLQLQGERGQRQLQFAASGRAGGTLGATPVWQGQLASLRVQLQDPALAPGPWVVQLRQAAPWRVAGGDFEFGAGEAVLQAPALRSGAPASSAVLGWAPVRQRAGQLSTAGRLAGLPLSWVELFGGPQLAGSVLAGDMVFDAEWNAQVGSTVRIDASLARVRGDVTVLAETAEGVNVRVAAGVRDARLTLSNQGEQLTVALLWDSERAGHAEGQLRTQLVRTAEGGWDWPEQAPLNGRLQAQLPRIGVWSLLAPPGWRLRGSLGADITLAGTRAEPQLSGPLTADQLALRSVVDGIELGKGRLRARLAGQKLVVDEFLLHGAEEGATAGGTLLARGEGEWTAQGMQLQVNAELAQLRASIRSDRQLTVSGPVAARVDRGGVNVTGQLVVDRARIQIADQTPPRLGDDVLVRNAPGLPTTEAERRLKPAASEGGRTLTMSITFGLGKDFRLSGRGVDTRLEGELEVSAQGSDSPQLKGLIRTVGGNYEAYGQRMRIERGEMRFTGPVDNPALDILALRPNMPAAQNVGVQVTGRAQAPHVELYSEPALSEADALSWLVLGRSSSEGGADTALLQRAASALLAERTGSGKGLAGIVGLDDVSVRPDSSGGAAIVSVGKRFADNFYAAYERSISSATGTLYLFYDVSRRLTVRAEAGERAGLDLIFTFFIDGGKKAP